MSIRIISTSNLINNPPPITNTPLREALSGIKEEYANSQNDLFKKELAKEKRIDRFMTLLLVGTLAATFLACRGVYKSTKRSIQDGINFATTKFNQAKTCIQQAFSKNVKNVKN